MSNVETNLSELKKRLNTLTSLAERLDNVRSASSILLERGLPTENPAVPDLTTSIFQAPPKLEESRHISSAHQNIRQFTQQMKLDETVHAFQAASEGNAVFEELTGVGLQEWLASRIGNRNDRAAVSDALDFNISTNSVNVVPPLRSSASPLTSSQLKDFLRSFNKSRANRRMSVRIVCRNKSPPSFRDPITVRMVLEDVFIAYITLGLDEMDTKGHKPLSIEFVNVFGSREAKPLHTSSDFAVFQQLTQYFSGIIRSNPELSLQSMLRILESYRDLFFTKCLACDRVASEEGHIPPIARLWRAYGPQVPAYEPTIDGIQHGELVASHLACM